MQAGSLGLIKSLWRIGRLVTVPWRHRVLSYPAIQQFCQGMELITVILCNVMLYNLIDNHSLTCGNTEAYPTIFSISKGVYIISLVLLRPSVILLRSIIVIISSLPLVFSLLPIPHR